MIQSTFHVAIIMDGNGRWATSRGRPRQIGHRAGAEAVRRIVTGAPDLGIDVLTLYAFSSDNWQRPITETSMLMRLFMTYLRRETPKPLARELAEWADVVVTMGCGDACPYIPGKRYLDWDLEDPKGQSLDAVRATRDEIDRRVTGLLAELDA